VSGDSTKTFFYESDLKMAEGTIKKVTQKGFGFIDTESGEDLFFHSSVGKKGREPRTSNRSKY